MKRLLVLLCGSTILAATLSWTAAAQEYSNGGTCAKGRGPAIVSPVDAFGVHPPGPDRTYCVFCWWNKTYIPYYAPLSPTATSVRWKPWCNFPLLPYYTPYYIGYCPHRLCKPKPPPYGSDGWGPGPMPDGPVPLDPSGTPLRYGPYTSVLLDDTIFWDMGGNGLVPYGAPRPPHYGPPDLVDMIQASRHGGGPCAPAGVPIMAWGGGAAPAIMPPAEEPDEKGGPKSKKERKGAPPPKKPEPPQ